MSTAPTLPDTDVDTDFGSIISEQFDHELDDSNDPETFSHYVTKEDIVRSATTGETVRALCGKKWTPKKNPERFPICPDCQAIFDDMPPAE